MRHLLCVSDDNYAQHLGVTIQSLLSCDGKPTDLVIHVVDCGISAPNLERLRGMVQGHRAVLDVIAAPMERFAQAPVSGHINRAAYFRILGPELLPDVSRFLYLDCDIVVVDDLEPLWATELDGRVVGAVRDFIGQERPVLIGMPEGSPYFNSGVLLFDADRWRREDVGGACQRFIVEHPEVLLYCDQDALNHELVDRWKPLDPRWNMQASVFMESHLRARRRELEPSAAVIHYSSWQKPWDFHTDHPRTRDYYRILDRTPWAGWRPPSTRAQRLKRTLRSFLPMAFVESLKVAIRRTAPPPAVV